MTDINNPKEDLTNTGLRHAAFSGNSRSNFLEVLDIAKAGYFDEAHQYIKMERRTWTLQGKNQIPFGFWFFACARHEHILTGESPKCAR